MTVFDAANVCPGLAVLLPLLFLHPAGTVRCLFSTKHKVLSSALNLPYSPARLTINEIYLNVSGKFLSHDLILKIHYCSFLCFICIVRINDIDS